MTSSQPYFLREIDGFRALAVLVVIIFHLNDALLPAGFSGVDVFFVVVSGSVVTKSLSQRGGARFGNYLGGFYRCRLLRIFPLLLYGLLAFRRPCRELASGLLLYQARTSRFWVPPAGGGGEIVLGSGFVLTLAGLVFSDPFNFSWSWAWALLAVAGVALFTVSSCLANGFRLFSQRSTLTVSVTANQYDWKPLATSVPEMLKLNGIGRPLDGLSLCVLGSSHTGAYKTMHETAERRLGAKVQAFQITICPVALLQMPNPADMQPCNCFVENLIHAIHARGNPGDLVFFSSLRTHRLVDQWGAAFEVDEVADLSHSKERLGDIVLARGRAAGMRSMPGGLGFNILIDLPKPVFRAVPFRCSDGLNEIRRRQGIDIERSLLEYMWQPVVDSLEQLKEDYSNVFLWDPMSVLCPSASFSAFINGRPQFLFFNGGHLSGLGSRSLCPDFERRPSVICQREAAVAELPPVSLGVEI